MRIKLWILTVLTSLSFSYAGQWAQWRGPNFDGTSDQTGLPETLDPNTMDWKTPLPGPGEATPVVCDGRVYLSGYEEDNKTLFAMCVDADNGKTLWKQTASTFEKLPGRNVIASPSPVADETGAVFMYSTGQIIKYDRDGNKIWQRNITQDYGPLHLDWSYSSSPLLYQNRLYVSVLRQSAPPKGSDYTGSMASYLLVLNPADGKTLFKVDRFTEAEGDYTDAYNTPIPITIDGRPYIVLLGGNYITGHDPATGAEQWRYFYKRQQERWGNVASTPVTDDKRIYCVYLTGAGAFACDLKKLAVNEPPLLWAYDKPVGYVSSAVKVGSAVYYLEEKKKILICLDAETGAERWVGQMDKADAFYASITAADGKLYTVNRKGTVTVVAADPDEFRIFSTYSFDEPPVDSTITIVNGNLYLRTAQHLYRFSTK